MVNAIPWEVLMPSIKCQGLSYPTHFLKSRRSVIMNNFLEYRTKQATLVERQNDIYALFASNKAKPGWVVTWFLLGYTVRMFEYTVRTFWSNVGRFLYVFSSVPRKLYTIFQPIKRYQDSIFKLLTLSTNFVTNVVRTAYFEIKARFSPLKILWQSLYSKY